LRADKQPIGIFIGYFQAMKSFIKNKIKNSTNDKIKIESKEKVLNVKPDIHENELFSKMLNLQIANFSKLPDTLELRKKIELLSDYVKLLKENNVNVYFFEMPINSNLMELPLAKTIRNELNSIFPTSMVNYIQIDSSLYETSDGVHLNNYEAVKYTTFFKRKLKDYR
jgi:hypothetical protein